MTTANDLVETTKRYLLSMQREARDTLNGGIDAAVTTLTVTSGNVSIQAGTYIEVDLEVMYVVSVAGTTVSVMRGEIGSVAAAHLSGAKVTVNPMFPKFAILNEINNELAALSSPATGLFRIATVDLAWQGSVYGYNLTGVADIESILSVQWEGYTGDEWVQVPATQWRLGRNQATSDFATGNALFFDSPVPGRTVRVVYRASFTKFSLLTDDVQAVSGLPATAEDIPPLGAAIRLILPREVKRSFPEAQGDTRRADEVPGGLALQSARGLLQLHAAAVNREATRLARDFPVMLAR